MTVSFEGLTATATVNVLAEGTATELTKLAVSPSECQLAIGEETQFRAVGYDSTGKPLTVGPIAWESAVGTIGVSGIYIAPEAPGTYTVSARYQGLTAKATIEVIGEKPEKGMLTWSGNIPAQKWMNFYMKVLTKFAARHNLKLHLDVEVTGGDGITRQHVEEMSAALRELDLDDDVRLG